VAASVLLQVLHPEHPSHSGYPSSSAPRGRGAVTELGLQVQAMPLLITTIDAPSLGVPMGLQHYVWGPASSTGAPQKWQTSTPKPVLSPTYRYWQTCVGLSLLLALGLGSRKEQTQSYSKNRAAKGLLKETSQFSQVFIMHFLKAVK